VALRGIQYNSALEDRIRRAFGIDTLSEVLRFAKEDLHLSDNIGLNFGTDDDAEVLFDGTRFFLNPRASFFDREGLPSRFGLEWIAGQHGKPGLNADIAPAFTGDDAADAASFLVANVADKQFEVLGTNATSALCTYNVEGGLVLTTDAVAGDQMILAPHLDTNQSAWSTVTWGTDQQTRWAAHIKTGPSIADVILWHGLKLTNTAVTTTDANQVFFRYEEGVNNGSWQAIDSISNSDNAADSGVAALANTAYHFVIDIQADRTAKMYINNVLVKTTGALANAIDLIPYNGVEVQGGGVAGAKVLRMRGQSISRNFA
jgi:hypothetical protein